MSSWIKPHNNTNKKMVCVGGRCFLPSMSGVKGSPVFYKNSSGEYCTTTKKKTYGRGQTNKDQTLHHFDSQELKRERLRLATLARLK